MVKVMDAMYIITYDYEHKHFKEYTKIHKGEHDDYEVKK